MTSSPGKSCSNLAFPGGSALLVLADSDKFALLREHFL
jgi:hypothetical protein